MREKKREKDIIYVWRIRPCQVTYFGKDHNGRVVVRRDTYTSGKKSARVYCKHYIAMRDVCLVIFSSIRVTASRLASQRESRVIVTIRVIKLLQIEETGDP